MLQFSTEGNLSLKITFIIFSLRTELARPVMRPFISSFMIWTKQGIIFKSPPSRQLYLQHSFSHSFDELRLALSESDVGDNFGLQPFEVGEDTHVLQCWRILIKKVELKLHFWWIKSSPRAPFSWPEYSEDRTRRPCRPHGCHRARAPAAWSRRGQRGRGRSREEEGGREISTLDSVCF